MRVSSVRKMGAALVTVMVGICANASSTLSLLPSSQNVTQGDTFTLTLMGSFPDGILGGGVDLFFNSDLFSFDALSFDMTLGDDPQLRRSPDVLNGELNGIAFGNFDGLFGTLTVAQLSFTALAPGGGIFSLAANEGGPPDQPGPFVSIGGDVIDDISFGSVQVSVQPVPLPAAMWLFGSAVSWLLLGLSRKQ